MMQGQKVYVRWYGKVLQGTVTKNTTPNDPLLGCMVAVTIPVLGTMATALFTPQHVYETPIGQEPSLIKREPSLIKEKPCVIKQEPCVIKKEPSVIEQAWPVSEDVALLAIRHFKDAHWDYEHNHLKVDSLSEFYSLWRNAYRAHRSEPVPSCETPTPPVTKKPSTPIQLSLFD